MARQVNNLVLLSVALVVSIVSCSSSGEAPGGPTSRTDDANSKGESPALADVIDVQVTGDAMSYLFAVTISSPDRGCDSYANWWEVVGEDGRLLYRRVLLHSHVDEQPFSRSDAPVPIAADQVVWLRAHMEPGGYGGMVLRGSVEGGFEAVVPNPDFAADLATSEPLPTSCAY